MKRVLTLSTLALMLTLPALAQDPPKLYTQATVPSREVLDKLSMTLAWRAKLPTGGARDGFTSVQVAPGVGGGPDTVFVQTYSGTVYALNAENGDLLWQTPVGLPYQVSQPVGFNSQSVFVVRREQLFVLDRATGQQQVYRLHKASKEPLYGIKLEEVPSAGLLADEDFVYVCMDHRISAYVIPNFQLLAEFAAREAKANKETVRPFLGDSPQPIRHWSKVLVKLQLDQPPRLTSAFLALAANDGTFLTLNAGKDGGQEIFRYKTGGAVRGAMGQHDNLIYVASEDYQVYAFDTSRAQLQWRYFGAAPIQSPAMVTNEDVFVVPDRIGLTRVDRATGRGVWSNKVAVRFLCTNYKFVYANDAQGRLLLLDYFRGTELARWDASSWTIPVPNDRTDRLFLANHDGQIMCLHHRDIVRPLPVRTPKEIVVKPPEDKKKKEKDKKEEMEKDKGGQLFQGPNLWEPRPLLARWEGRPEVWAELRAIRPLDR
jgi:outer membrane protein assembly factor BamB